MKIGNLTQSCRYLSLFVVLLLIQPTQARSELPTDIPDSYCEVGYYDCSSFSMDLTKRYWLAKRPDLSAQEILAVGSCHMVNSRFNPEHEHFGHLYLKRDQVNNQVLLFGEFSFFTPSNPYIDWNLDTARSAHAKKQGYTVYLSRESASVPMSEDPIWIYFIRQETNHLLLVGLWGPMESINCDLKIVDQR